MYIMRFLVIMSLLTLNTLVESSEYEEYNNCNNNDINCCYGNWNIYGTECECWSLQIFGSKCNYVCRDDLCNGLGICDENSNPVYMNGSFYGKCVCDNPELNGNDMCDVENDIGNDGENGEDMNEYNYLDNDESNSGSNSDIGISNMERTEINIGASEVESNIYLYVLLGVIFVVFIFLILFTYKRNMKKEKMEKKDSKVSISVQTVQTVYSDSEYEESIKEYKINNSFMDLTKEFEEGENISKRIMSR